MLEEDQKLEENHIPPPIRPQPNNAQNIMPHGSYQAEMPRPGQANTFENHSSPSNRSKYDASDSKLSNKFVDENQSHGSKVHSNQNMREQEFYRIYDESHRGQNSSLSNDQMLQSINHRRTSK